MCFDGTSVLQDWMVWSDHPVRKEYEIIMDLGDELLYHCISRRVFHSSNTPPLPNTPAVSPQTHSSSLKRKGGGVQAKAPSHRWSSRVTR